VLFEAVDVAEERGGDRQLGLIVAILRRMVPMTFESTPLLEDGVILDVVGVTKKTAVRAPHHHRLLKSNTNDV